MGIGLEINAVMEETDENSLKLNKIDITPKQSFGLNQLREKLPTHLKELFNRSLANLNNQQAGKKHINADGLSRIPDDIEACRNYRPDVNLEELPCGGLELHEEQMKDSDLKTLKRWIEDKYEPTKAELKLCSEVVRHFWSLRQQIQIKDNILLYKWEDPISPRLLFMTPKQMQKELLHGCHDVVSSGHMGQYKTLEKLKQIAVWLNMTQSCKLVHDIARDNLKASQERQKGIYDLKYNQNVYNVGDVVYKLNQATKVGQSAKLKSPWKGPYLITAWRSPVLYKIKDRKTESWIHHDRVKLCEDRELPIWIKRMRNQLMDQTMDEEPNEI
ncbi:unnamed protein product [Mytilus edulis]|uniref:Integrase zinc-binding domain-containing protein n=1 Tax=Mytilus edulis TaxID=6550 RepID=A0A8S3RCV3_MYTED|nr:unnamed protein product [Mytilus edulis]